MTNNHFLIRPHGLDPLAHSTIAAVKISWDHETLTVDEIKRRLHEEVDRWPDTLS